MTTLAIVPLMWIPGLVGFACSNQFGNKLRDLALIKPGPMSMVLAYVIPVLMVSLVTGALIVAGIVTPRLPAESYLRLAFFKPLASVGVAFILAAGEEIGWRGYFQTHLMRAKVPAPILVTGFIWSLSYWPLILWVDYAKSPMPWLSAVLFTVSMTGFSVFLSWLRNYSKSIVPVALAHATHTVWMRDIGPAFYLPGRLSPYFAGEAGFAAAILYAVIGYFIYTKLIPKNI